MTAASASAGRSRLSSCGLIGASSLQTAASKPVRKAENRLGSTRSMIMAPSAAAPAMTHLVIGRTARQANAYHLS